MSRIKNYFDDLWQSSEVSPASYAPYTEKTMAQGYCETLGAAQGSNRHRHCRAELERRLRQIEQGIAEMESLLARSRAMEEHQRAILEMTPEFRQIEDGYVRFVHDAVESVKVQTTEELTLRTLGADESILIQSPYIVPGVGLLHLLDIKQREGVAVTVVTNSVKSTVNLVATAGTERYKKQMLDVGVTFLESTGDQMLHAKSMVYRSKESEDGDPPCWGVIGSFNIDPRSAKLNTETLVVVQDCAFADELEETIRLYSEDSIRVASRDDLAASKDLGKEISFGKRFTLAILKFLTPLYRSQI